MVRKSNGRSGHNSGSLWLTRSYNFIDKDPECDHFRTIFQREHIKESDLAVLAGLSKSTVTNMFGGKTRRPLHSTFAKMAGAMKYKYSLVRDTDAPNYVREIPKAREQYNDHRANLQRKRRREAAKK
jgi:transcriptional regulator with XRE-family HTH domain